MKKANVSATPGVLRLLLLAMVLVATPAWSAGSIALSASSFSAGEGSGPLLATLRRSGSSAGAVSVQYASSNGSAQAGSDYGAVTGSVAWADGESGDKSIALALVDDAVFEKSETVKLTLSGVVNATLGRAAATLTIDDDDSGLAFSQKAYSVGEGGVAGITVYRLGRLSGAISVSYASANGSALAGSDYSAAAGTLSWASGDGKPKSFALATLADTQREATETVQLNLSAASGATLTTMAVTLRIADDDAPALNTGNPVLFVTQVPVSGFLVVSSPFGAHEGFVNKAPRGGDLMIRYADGTLRNLTREAGYGVDGFQGANAIAVRQPSVHWSGQKALFSMVVGGNTRQYQTNPARWQLYEVSGLQQGQTAVITKLPGQPAAYNNIAPAYGSDDQVIFISDRPRNGAAHLYPQRDEYESANVDTGLWKLDPLARTFKLIEHAPSGVSYPSIDSAGRVIFTKWDHLQRDQQADADAYSPPQDYKYGAFNYDSEAQTTPPAAFSIAEFFPELRRAAYSMPYGEGYDGTSIAPDYAYSDFTFNHFFPWMLNQDGSEEETLNHVGRQEIGGSYSVGSFRHDSTLRDIRYGEFTGGTEFLGGDGGMFHLREDPTQPGLFYGSHAPEFSTHTAGDIVRLQGRRDVNAEDMRLERVMARAGVGRLRNPLPLANGQLLVVHTGEEGNEQNLGTTAAPVYNYGFRLRGTRIINGQRVPDAFVTGGIDKSVSYWSPDVKVNWSGTLWELDPVEVRTRSVPRKTLAPALPAPETQVLQQAGVNPALLRNWLHAHNLALVVMRNVTTRDRADRQQPFNLMVPGGVFTMPSTGATPYELARLQFFQGDQIRGYAPGKPPQQGGTPAPGRRVLAVPLHTTAAIDANPPVPAGAPPGSYAIAVDGSVAAFVPARRAMAWQLVDTTGQPIVRERNWLSFKPGETRSCPSCHGVNKRDQDSGPVPQNPPQALGALLGHWKSVVRGQCAAGGSGSWSYSGVSYSACDEGKRYRIQVCSGGDGCCGGLPATETLACGS